jgi:hypothetical protein
MRHGGPFWEPQLAPRRQQKCGSGRMGRTLLQECKPLSLNTVREVLRC